MGDMFTKQFLAAFTADGAGGNPAGVVIIPPPSGGGKAADFPQDDIMLGIAGDIGYSETVFARPDGNRWRVRYFAPGGEVDFCGHATIALGAALGREYGPGKYDIELNGEKIIPVVANTNGSATLTSPPTQSRPLQAAVENPVLTAFGLGIDDIDPAIGTRMVNAGNDHVLIGLKSRARLAAMDYDFAAMSALMREHTITTIALMVRESDTAFHVRNAFAFGGVVEDPATGAAAAAIAGYLRETGQVVFDGGRSEIVFHQGDDMGVPCRIFAAIPETPASGIDLTGYVREIK